MSTDHSGSGETVAAVPPRQSFEAVGATQTHWPRFRKTRIHLEVRQVPVAGGQELRHRRGRERSWLRACVGVGRRGGVLVQEQTAAAALEGLTLLRGWQVISRMPKPPGATGGFFSESYIVQHADGREAHLKAFDYSSALSQPNAADALQALTSAYIFERDLLARCATAHMSRVVLAFDSGDVDVPGFGLLSRVNYLIFEKAERDVRRHRDLMQRLDVAWVLRSLHHVATGLSQLHHEGISHQDLKPSNVLVFEDESSKVGDLGRAARQGQVAPHEALVIAGDRTYAPPELLYGQADPDAFLRRRASDMYQLGSMEAFFFTGLGTTASLANELAPNHLWGNWSGPYPQVLPYVRDAFDRVVVAFQGQAPAENADKLTQAFRELCDPDPSLRGDPKAWAGSSTRYSMQRYVSRFDWLARDAEIRLRRAIGP
jgi:eukaryotic-like serine/threonine-protein kinase